METSLQNLENHIARCQYIERDLEDERSIRETLEKTVLRLGNELKDFQQKEQSYVDDRSRLLSQNSKLEERLKFLIDQNNKNAGDQKHAVAKLSDSLQIVRSSLSEKHEEVGRLKNEIVRLKEENEMLGDTLSDMRNVASSKDMRIFNKYDELLSKFISLFSNDEENIRHRFLEKKTNCSNYAFRLLVQVCHDDLTGRFSKLKIVIPSPESMVDAVLYHKIDITACTYARTMQLTNSNLFDESNIANSRSKDLTRFQIQNNQLEIGNARANFVAALMGAMSAIPGNTKQTDSSDIMLCDNVCDMDVACGQDTSKRKLENSKALGFD